MIVATCVAEDEAAGDRLVNYPQIARLSQRERSRAYWRCAIVSMASAIRCQPSATLRIYSNNPAQLAKCDRQLPAWLKRQRIELHPLPFVEFRPPPDESRSFRNAFYKHEVLNHLAETTRDDCILVDSDCLWLRSPTGMIQALRRGGLVAIDLTEGFAPDSIRHGQSRQALSTFFEELLQEPRDLLPHWIGGELVAGGSDALRRAARLLRNARERVSRGSSSRSCKLPNGHGVFDNDEYLATLAWAAEPELFSPANAFAVRLWTSDDGWVSMNDLRYELWHLPAEKDRGFVTLFPEVMNPDSTFWRCPLDEFAQYLGAHVGVPTRRVAAKQSPRARAMACLKTAVKTVIPETAWTRLRRWVYERA